MELLRRGGRSGSSSAQREVLGLVFVPTEFVAVTLGSHLTVVLVQALAALRHKDFFNVSV